MGPVKQKLPRRGAAAVEAALLLPLGILLVFGLMEFGWVFLRAQQITHAARHGARIAATADATNADVEAAIMAWMNEIGITDYSWSASPTDVSAVETGETVTITVTGNGIRLVNIPVIPAPSSYTASVSMSKEGT
jgi:Flp pilus assembly protein TadG